MIIQVPVYGVCNADNQSECYQGNNPLQEAAKSQALSLGILSTSSKCKKLGIKQVKQRWQELNGDCYFADKLLEDVSNWETNARKRRNSSNQQCLNGYLKGLSDSLSKVVGDCASKCGRVGSAFGKVSATMFCAISRKIGRAASFKGRHPVKNIICGASYSSRCQSSFVYKAKNSCASYAYGPAFRAYYKPSKGGCCSYTKR
ncbi:hypothetical protein TI05_16985 [Achromatium sp. WMS3]|nr:hypothetical protein TI05_16985 [Achromatium sp. WMS3]